MSLSDLTWRPPRLETDRLLLRGWDPKDVESVFAYASDPEVTRFMSWDQHRSLEDSRAFLDVFVAEQYGAQELEYCVCLKSDPAIAIGGVGAYWRSRPHGTMELGYVLRRSSWGGGFMPEAGRGLIRHAFESTDVMRIFAQIFPENTPSRRAAEKMGLTFEGVQRSAVRHRHRRWDQAIYAILRGEGPPQ